MNNKNYFEEDVYHSFDLILEPDENKVGGLYLGGIDAAKDIEKLERKKIFAILTVAKGTNLTFDEEKFV